MGVLFDTDETYGFITFIRRKYFSNIFTIEFIIQLFFILALLEYDSNIVPVSKQYTMIAHVLNVAV